MAFKIIWSEFSEAQLDKIYDYYKEKVNSKVATKLISGIIEEPNKLLKMPYLGQEEEFLQDRNSKYHYLVFKNYKIIYTVEEESRLIKIADVFDTRQNPKKLKRTK
ncbi:hypothetical protein A33Q_1728 [Indibacter alkaliphilus LW1]|uniref:Plasmid stabilization system protein ParE n=1 Tax=Indibacter alkaliphilus (strain CCUG 57479 / KCTC 22604 / LW1) TaxID=1189612 RepID=S2DKJ8_INDAL|nr:type II toxin-antitoxin system RelE/ParE family toxin [Indibacter alkaliphilus]EOZ97755.1 hypothetical protein A33Q_1728 [Indibacter alkaliphilus LW1]